MYEYKPGKQDWLASGLPREGREADLTFAGDVALKDTPTCALGDRVGDVRRRLKGGTWKSCPVVNESRTVLGLLDGAALESDPETLVEQAMIPGPRTFRAGASLEKIARYMQEHGMDGALITDSDGVLLGVFRPDSTAQSGKSSA